jgi:hypothetical protein
MLTTDLKKAAENSPYDVIILYDVIDHVKNQKPAEIFQMLRSFMHIESKVYMRTHPLASRHGGHLYKKLNKAFAHIIFTPTNCKKWATVDDTQRVCMPMATYAGWFHAAGLTEKAASTERQFVEPFFERPEILKRILINMPQLPGPGLPRFQLEQCFNDYTLMMTA